VKGYTSIKLFLRFSANREVLAEAVVSASEKKVVAKPPAKRAAASKPASKCSMDSLPLDYEKRLWDQGVQHVCGVDEAGRGPLAGPVVAAACLLPAHWTGGASIAGVNDSKSTTEADREATFAALVACPDVRFSIAVADHRIIDRVNILQATYAAMHAAVQALPIRVQHALVDGNRIPHQLADQASAAAEAGGAPFAVEAVVKGDGKVYSIAAASILAKVTRDRIMAWYDEQYPGYGLQQHKGYPTGAHRAAVAALGPSPIHRLTFAPLKGVFGQADIKGQLLHVPPEVLGCARVQQCVLHVPVDVPLPPAAVAAAEAKAARKAAKAVRGTKRKRS